MKLFLLLLILPIMAHAEFTLDTKVTIIEQFACGGKTCGVALGENQEVYMFVLDAKGLTKVYQKGVQVYCRDCKQV